MAVKEIELTTLWDRVIEEVAVDAPQHRAFLQLTKPLGLLHNNDQTTLLVAAPNLFAKDVLESRLRTVVCDVLTRELGDKASIAVTVDESLESAEPQTPEVEIEFVAPRLERVAKKHHQKLQRFHNLTPATSLKLSLSVHQIVLHMLRPWQLLKHQLRHTTRCLFMVSRALEKPTYYTLLAPMQKSSMAAFVFATFHLKSSQMTLLTPSAMTRQLLSSAATAI
jgi:hypothetical protein